MNVKKAGIYVGRVWSNKMDKTITVAVKILLDGYHVIKQW